MKFLGKVLPQNGPKVTFHIPFKFPLDVPETGLKIELTATIKSSEVEVVCEVNARHQNHFLRSAALSRRI